jgi:3',5'-cyclic AMP phosphodiesterase CpdA
VAIFGDMGNENAQSLARLQEDTQRRMYDAIIHVGDFAYDMNSENALVGDQFMNQIQQIAAYLPYMVCPGNHEEK